MSKTLARIQSCFSGGGTTETHSRFMNSMALHHCIQGIRVRSTISVMMMVAVWMGVRGSKKRTKSLGMWDLDEIEPGNSIKIFASMEFFFSTQQTQIKCEVTQRKNLWQRDLERASTLLHGAQFDSSWFYHLFVGQILCSINSQQRIRFETSWKISVLHMPRGFQSVKRKDNSQAQQSIYGCRVQMV
jgi:hypothetical protein